MGRFVRTNSGIEYAGKSDHPDYAYLDEPDKVVKCILCGKTYNKERIGSNNKGCPHCLKGWENKFKLR